MTEFSKLIYVFRLFGHKIIWKLFRLFVLRIFGFNVHYSFLLALLILSKTWVGQYSGDSG